MKRLRSTVDRLLTVERPVTYWSFWWVLVRLVPVAVVLFAVITVATGVEFTYESFAPVPFVFVAASFGYAVRNLDRVGGLISLSVAGVYGFVLWLSGSGALLLRRPTTPLWVVAGLAFVAMVAGFASPWVHGRGRDREFTRAYREHKLDDDE